MLPEREKQIGARMRVFREMLQIPRTKFSVAIGYGGERIAAYEAGRARLPYHVFKSIANRYDIYPRWLAEGEGSPQIKNSFDDRPFLASLTRTALFSDVYDQHLSSKLARSVEQAGADASATVELLTRAIALLEHVEPGTLTAAQRRKILQFNALQARLIRKIKAELGIRDVVNAKPDPKRPA
jgi:hypothetical protein